MKHNFFEHLSKEEYEILANKGTEAPLQANIMIIMNQDFLFAEHVQTNYMNQIQNLILVVDGHLLMMRSREQLLDMKIIH